MTTSPIIAVVVSLFHNCIFRWNSLFFRAASHTLSRVKHGQKKKTRSHVAKVIPTSWLLSGDIPISPSANAEVEDGGGKRASSAARQGCGPAHPPNLLCSLPQDRRLRAGFRACQDAEERLLCLLRPPPHRPLRPRPPGAHGNGDRPTPGTCALFCAGPGPA